MRDSNRHIVNAFCNPMSEAQKRIGKWKDRDIAKKLASKMGVQIKCERGGTLWFFSITGEGFNDEIEYVSWAEVREKLEFEAA